MYLKSKTEGDNFYLGVYVNDIVPAGESEARIAEVKQMLASQFIWESLSIFRYVSGPEPGT